MSEATEIRLLLSQYAEIAERLGRHPWVRNHNAPLGDVAENLVAIALGGRIADNNAKGYDVELSDGHRVQVKGITYRGKDNLMTSAIRSMDFDSVAIVVCNPTFEIVEGLLVKKEQVMEISRFHKTLNGHQIRVKQARSVASNITDELRAVWH